MSKALDVLLELKDCSDYWSEYFVPLGIHERIDDAIKELLAQPEQTEQEPVAWMYEWDTTTTGHPTCKYVNMGKDKPNVEANFLARNFIPLYASPQNREPLSDEEMRAIWKEGIRGEIPFVEIGRAIEKAHGIGEDHEYIYPSFESHLL